MKNSKFLIILFSILLTPTLILSNTRKVDACDPSNPLCQTKEIPRVPSSNTEKIDAKAKKERAAVEEARNRAKTDADKRKQDEMNRAQAEKERLAEKERAAVEKAEAEERGERVAARNNEHAKLIIETLRVIPDVRNISLEKDIDRKLKGVCYEQKEFSHTQSYHDSANHPNAYTDGYREGKMNAQKGEKYVPRTGGGEFSRGFDDGYYGKKSTGADPAAIVPDSSQDVYKWNQKCAALGKKANTKRAKTIIETLLVLPNVRQISLQTDPDRKLMEVCYQQQEFSHKEVKHDNANHPNAYTDGYREGKMNAQKGEKYVPRTGGGEFSRGFDDGYYGKNSTGQDANATVPDSSQDIHKWNQKCAALDGDKANNEIAKIIIGTLRDRSDVRNISLQTDPVLKSAKVCYQEQEFSHNEVRHDNANHPNAYTDGYREGKMNAQKGEKYVPRTGGGEFSRGFDDGYYGKNSTGQDANATVNDTSEKIYKWNEKCTGI